MEKNMSVFTEADDLFSSVPAACAENTETKTINNAAQLMQIIDPDFKSPISITKAVLTRNGCSENIYLVILSGVKSPLKNVNNIPSCILAGVSLKNPYLAKVKELMSECIPTGSDVIFAGHSLGGMVAQQAASDRELNVKYNILNITAFGSPLVPCRGREGILHRLADKNDFIPLMSITGIRNVRYAISFETAGHDLVGVKAHTGSYTREDVWGAYDCFGVKGGDAVLSYSEADMFRYPYLPNSYLF